MNPNKHADTHRLAIKSNISMPKTKQFVGRWVAWKNGHRFVQELHEDGKFEAIVFDEEDTICHAVIGTWNVEGDFIHWRYLKGGPKYVDKNKIVSVGKKEFSIEERDGALTVFYRELKGGAEASANFDTSEVSRFLKRLSKFVKSGFSSAQATRLSREMKKLKPEGSHQYVFPIRFEGSDALLGIRVFMDDVDAPDLYIYGPLKFVRMVDKELEKLDPERLA